jgi:hypothetical protein
VTIWYQEPPFLSKSHPPVSVQMQTLVKPTPIYS